ncbi:MULTISPECIES: serine hydrolase [Bacillus]|uniref:Penicillin-binding protein n=1 Tax=Bacillus thuringiensis serovar sooncheon TaxID=180891 RepID=A0A9Q5SL03_BACTU|nr:MULTISPECIES: serine hydrolase domain-containing protein [Bacillus]MDC7975233.1 serine hydrolase [Bacillus sp. BLCC-B18]OTW71582.1 penicillin-binding protein [Bacillus thuringiensis serovar coreanensis]OTX55202.1 penicillin-binding protein [Bacillus thuringiensis serovar sooncheon]OTX58539.1 penicillin-binding protein [Bacillus thuringiensis serovar guiyangiensis]OTX72830.1 penicillin-binding protein [Bacillus thuringiensis serovar roskildiensis]
MYTYDKLISWVENIKEKNHSSATALCIIKDNKIVLEHYSGHHSNTSTNKKVTASSQFNVASARKSYLGLMVAYALYEGKINSIDDEAIKYFKDFDSALLGKTTIRHLVTHSHGLGETNDGTIFREFEPGQAWAYRDINVRMITRLIYQLYNKSFPELLKERVFDLADFKETGWRIQQDENLVKVVNNPSEDAISEIGTVDDGTEKNLFVSAREFAQWGNLHLNRGMINSKKIVPKEVIKIATSLQSPTFVNKELPQNGLFWFVQNDPALLSELGERVPKGSFQILGITGPTILVIPEYNVVVAKMYNKRYNYGGDNYLYYLREFSNLVADTFRNGNGA